MHFVSNMNQIMSESEKLERPATATDAKEENPAEVIESDAILKGKQEVLIQHGETMYRLRITQNGKLILCK
jgi:hemin uptake protein HemP